MFVTFPSLIVCSAMALIASRPCVNFVSPVMQPVNGFDRCFCIAAISDGPSTVPPAFRIELISGARTHFTES